jgi:hypothetical protein
MQLWKPEKLMDKVSFLFPRLGNAGFWPADGEKSLPSEF